jgi:hypothetical protein
MLTSKDVEIFDEDKPVVSRLGCRTKNEKRAARRRAKRGHDKSVRERGELIAAVMGFVCNEPDLPEED